jgi:hypothetical protein
MEERLILLEAVRHQMNLWIHEEDEMIMIRIKIWIKEYYHQWRIFEIHLKLMIMYQDEHTKWN